MTVWYPREWGTRGYRCLDAEAALADCNRRDEAGVSIWKLKARSGHRTDAMGGRYVRDLSLFANNAAGAVL